MNISMCKYRSHFNINHFNTTCERMYICANEWMWMGGRQHTTEHFFIYSAAGGCMCVSVCFFSYSSLHFFSSTWIIPPLMAYCVYLTCTYDCSLCTQTWFRRILDCTPTPYIHTYTYIYTHSIHLMCSQRGWDKGATKKWKTMCLNVKMNLSLPIATEIINVTATESSMIYTNVVHIFIPVEEIVERNFLDNKC